MEADAEKKVKRRHKKPVDGPNRTGIREKRAEKSLARLRWGDKSCGLKQKKVNRGNKRTEGL